MITAEPKTMLGRLAERYAERDDTMARNEATTTERTFEEWMVAVNRQVGRLVGMDVDDLPDCPYQDWYVEGMTPGTAARNAVARANK